MSVTIQDAGPCKKKLVFEIPQEEVREKFSKSVDERTKTAQLPGFRPGRAPRRLVERKLRDEIGDQVKLELMTDAYKKAVEEHKLDVLREEEFDPEKVELPQDGPLAFEMEVEVMPEIALPDYAAMSIEVPRLEASEAELAQALENVRRSRGRFVEQPARTVVAERDMLTADVKVTVGGETLLEQTDGGLPVFPQSLAGIRVEKLAEALVGKKAGDSATLRVKVPEDHEKEPLRGQEAEVAISIKAVRRIEAPALDEELAKSLGYEKLDDLKADVRRRVESETSEARDAARRGAVAQWLLDHVPLEVPEGVARANAGRLFNQQVVSLQRRGVPIPAIQERAEELLEACRQRAQRDLKLLFIFNSIAKKESIEATEDEVQARVGLIAATYNRPVDRVYEEMEKRGYLEGLRDQVREDKAYQFLLNKARVTEVEPPAPAPEAASPPAATEEAFPEAPAQAEQAPAEPEAPAKPKARVRAKAKKEERPAGEAAEEPTERPAKKSRARKKPASKDDAEDETTRARAQ